MENIFKSTQFLVLILLLTATNSGSDSTQSSVSNPEVKRTKKINYFHGQGQKNLGTKQLGIYRYLNLLDIQHQLLLTYINSGL